MRKVLARDVPSGTPVLVATDEIAAEELGLLPSGKDLLVSAKSPRNPRQHRLAWALAQKLSESCDFLHDREDAMDYLKIRCRHVKWISNPKTGNVFPVPKSIAYASLDQAAFNRLLRRMIYVICTEIVPGLPESDLRAEIEAMVVGDDFYRQVA